MVLIGVDDVGRREAGRGGEREKTQRESLISVWVQHL